jgi:signal transduction histidine kinase/CheY-like chemotaxis protein/HPt (histidine-containing phosphotransfer) domain-containing protein
MSLLQSSDDHGLHDAVSLWTGIGLALALLVLWPNSDAAPGWILASWVGAHGVLAVAAWLVKKGAQRAIVPGWYKARPAHLLMLLSLLLWSLGVVLFTGHAQAESNLPMYLVASGLACAAVWLLQGDLVLIVASQLFFLMPMLFRLLGGNEASIAAGLLFMLLIVANALISWRFNAAGGRLIGVSPIASGGNQQQMALLAQESKFQNERLAQELKSELERHKNIEEELKSAKQAAEAAAMAKGEFLATMSHEIRTPLNGIIPLLEILRDSKLQPDQRDYLNTAYGSAKQLLNIIDDILDYSKIEANKIELEQVGINLREILDSVIRLMERPAHSKNLKLQLVIDPSVRIAGRGDATRLRQVLTNLVSNAVKFTERGGVQVHVSKRSESKTHQDLLFAIKDTGVGITPEGQAKLFKAFQQADTSTTRVFGGTGLGLVICQRIVTLMGGQIGVKSEPGKGSVFWFQIPVLKAVGDMGGARRDLQGVRALLITSEPRMQQRYTGIFNGQGMTLTVSNSTADALSKLKSSSTLGENWAFDVAILDALSMKATAAGFLRNAQREAALEKVSFLALHGAGDSIPSDAINPRRAATGNLQASDGEIIATLNRLLQIEQATEQRFSLLQEAAALGQDQNDAAALAAKLEGPITGHVLLVEDNPVNRTVALRVLGLIGVSAQAAENGKEAIDMLGSGKFDLVLMDCQMPVMDGYTATRTRRTLEDERGIARIPIVAMTANAMVGDREKCLASGMDDYMSKPLVRALMEQTLRKWLPAGAKTREEHLPEGLRPAPAAIAPAAAAVAPLISHEEQLMAELAAAGQTLTPSARAAPARPAAAKVAKYTPPNRAAVDRAVFDELLDVMGSEFSALIKVYLEDTPRSLRALVQAAESGNIDGMVAPAHSLKSTSANLGALVLSDMAKAIEHNARLGQLNNAIEAAHHATYEFDRVAAELTRLNS